MGEHLSESPGWLGAARGERSVEEPGKPCWVGKSQRETGINSRDRPRGWRRGLAFSEAEWGTYHGTRRPSGGASGSVAKKRVTTAERRGLTEETWSRKKGEPLGGDAHCGRTARRKRTAGETFPTETEAGPKSQAGAGVPVLCVIRPESTGQMYWKRRWRACVATTGRRASTGIGVKIRSLPTSPRLHTISLEPAFCCKFPTRDLGTNEPRFSSVSRALYVQVADDSILISSKSPNKVTRIGPPHPVDEQFSGRVE